MVKMKGDGPQQTLRLWVLMVVVGLWSAEACFIRNCPIGGKRGLSTEHTRQCVSCGASGRGQCVGPSICCGPDMGCMMGTAEAEVCQKENESTVPCSVKGRECGVDNMGNCVANGICCVEGACSYNSHCKLDKEEDTEATRNELLGLIRRLLVSRQYD